MTGILQFTEYQLIIEGIDNSAESRSAFVASQTVTLVSTSVDYWDDGAQVVEQAVAIRASGYLRLINPEFTATEPTLFLYARHIIPLYPPLGALDGPYRLAFPLVIECRSGHVVPSSGPKTGPG